MSGPATTPLLKPGVYEGILTHTISNRNDDSSSAVTKNIPVEVIITVPVSIVPVRRIQYKYSFVYNGVTYPILATAIAQRNRFTGQYTFSLADGSPKIRGGGGSDSYSGIGQPDVVVEPETTTGGPRIDHNLSGHVRLINADGTFDDMDFSGVGTTYYTGLGQAQ